MLTIEDIKIAPDGTAKNRLDLWGLKSLCKSFVLIKIIIATMKLTPSINMFAKPCMDIPKPYHSEVKGQNICTPSFVKKSPKRICCVNAAK